MTYEPLLLSISEIAATLAGLTAIAAVLTKEVEQKQMFAVRDVVEINVVVLLIALLPVVLYHNGISEADAWQIGLSVGLLIATVGFTRSVLMGWAMWREAKALLSIAVSLWILGAGWGVAYFLDLYPHPERILVAMLFGLLGVACLIFLEVLLPAKNRGVS